MLKCLTTLKQRQKYIKWLSGRGWYIRAVSITVKSVNYFTIKFYRFVVLIFDEMKIQEDLVLIR